MTDEQMEIWNLVRESNRAWMSDSVHELASFFEEKAVLVKPDLAGRIEGRDAIVESYQDFVHHARTHAFEEREHSVEVFGDLAMVAYRFSVRYTLLAQDEEREETGEEILALRRGAEGWKVLWRTQLVD